MTNTLTTESVRLHPHDLNREFCEAFNAADLPRLMRMYERDAVLVPGPGAPELRGHAAIEKSLHELLALGATGSFVPRVWLTHGDLVMSSVNFTMTGGHDAEGNPVELQGITFELARRQADGSWKYVIDHPFGGGA